MELKAEDLKIDAFHAERIGGWSTQQPTAIRVTHTPTGISVTRSDDRSQYRNRVNAVKDLTEAVEKYYKQCAAPKPVNIAFVPHLKKLLLQKYAACNHARKILVSGINSI